MKRMSLLIVCAAALTTTSCETIIPAFDRGAALNAVCVTGYKATVNPRPPGGAPTDSASFQATFTNPLPQDAVGSLQVKMGVEARGIELGVPPTNVSASSNPNFATPVSTIYPAGVKDGYASPVAITVPHDPYVHYDIEIYTNIPGLDYDGTPCHTFKATNIKL